MFDLNFIRSPILWWEVAGCHKIQKSFWQIFLQCQANLFVGPLFFLLFFSLFSGGFGVKKSKNYFQPIFSPFQAICNNFQVNKSLKQIFQFSRHFRQFQTTMKKMHGPPPLFFFFGGGGVIVFFPQEIVYLCYPNAPTMPGTRQKVCVRWVWWWCGGGVVLT